MDILDEEKAFYENLYTSKRSQLNTEDQLEAENFFFGQEKQFIE